jgi:hypothetical protein
MSFKRYPHLFKETIRSKVIHENVKKVHKIDTWKIISIVI